MTRNCLRACTALTVVSLATSAAHAQSESRGLEEIIVTAQKREQSVQDIPIAVTAVTQETIAANRITSVNDLSSIAPGVSVRQTTGGIQSPAFTIRGQLSYGFVAGSDKQTSIYLDGVYIGSPRGSIFDLPDIQRLEVLRGPQGTLFGRNATAGAVSVVTREPNGDAGVTAELTMGNRSARRFRLSAELPRMGPFSGYFSFLRREQHGDIRNATAGLVWNRSLATGYGSQTSAKYLGSVDSNSYFGALKFEPSDSFKLVYKYDRFEDSGTPDGTGALSASADFGNPLVNNLYAAIVAGNNLYLAPNGRRPKIVTNGFAMARDQLVQGHSVTASWQAADNLTVKNIFAYRKAFLSAPTPIDGVSSLIYPQGAVVPQATLAAFSLLGTPAGTALGITSLAAAQAAIPSFIPRFQPLVGQRLLLVTSQAASTSRQWSDELQVNYSTDQLALTTGALWFHSKDEAGGPPGMKNTFGYRFGTNTIFPQTGLIPLGDAGRYGNKATSIAAYAQAEYNFTPEVTLITGARINKDKKDGTFAYDVAGVQRPTIVAPTYKDTRLSYSIGLNWEPNADTLVYGKYSSSFVSGGNTAGVEFKPEIAKSFELGAKADLLNRRLRANLALFSVDYHHVQGSGSTNTPQSAAYALSYWTPLYGATTANEMLAAASTFVIDQGTLRARGFELELTALPLDGVTVGTSLGYTDTKYTKLDPLWQASIGTANPIPTDRPKWTGNAYVQYVTPPISGDMTVLARLDGQYRSRTYFRADAKTSPLPDVAKFTDPYLLLNGRLALQNISLGAVKAELALWGRNLTDRKDILYALDVRYTVAANYVQARSYGIDLKVAF